MQLALVPAARPAIHNALQQAPWHQQQRLSCLRLPTPVPQVPLERLLDWCACASSEARPQLLQRLRVQQRRRQQGAAAAAEAHWPGQLRWSLHMWRCVLPALAGGQRCLDAGRPCQRACNSSRHLELLGCAVPRQRRQARRAGRLLSADAAHCQPRGALARRQRDAPPRRCARGRRTAQARVQHRGRCFVVTWVLGA